MTEKRPVGRPTEYKPEYAEQARQLCENGALRTEIAKFFGVNPNTINDWRIRHKEFAESLKMGDEIACLRVAESLYNRANGYEHEVEKPFIDQKSGQVVIGTHIERLPPDPTSMIFFLKNKMPDQWRDRREVEANVKGDIGANPLEQLAASIAALADKLASDDDSSD